MIDESKPSSPYHIPVMLNEAVEALKIQPSGTYVDCTFGGGGHSAELLKQLGEDGRLIAFDQDVSAQVNIPLDDERLLFIPQNFRHIGRFLRYHNIGKVNGIIADLGVSSHQFDEAERGFSTRFNALLDMRMDLRQSKTAAQVLATMPEAGLQQMFSNYGEVTNAKTLAKRIATARAIGPITTIDGFKAAIKEVVKGNPNKYFAQVFQALRIEVNEELLALEEMLDQTPGLLQTGGRLVIITFHSLEDRIVKNFMKTGSVKETEVDEVFGTRSQSPFTLITKKPKEAGLAEQKLNPRSRSAKLRVAEKI